MQALRGTGAGPAFALTWVPAEALRSLTGQGPEADAAETLAAVAVALELDMVFVPAAEPWAVDAVRLLRHADVAAVWAVSGVLTRVADRQGWTEVISRTASEPGALAFTLSDALHDALDDVRRGRFVSVDAVCVADDLASDSGWLLSPDFALEALVPCYRQLAAETDAPVVFHSDGDIRLIYPALRTGGYCAVHVAARGTESTTRSFTAARAAGLTPMGGIEARRVMTVGATDTGRFAGDLAAHGPAVLCDDGGLSTAEELAAYTTALDAARRVSETGRP